VASFTRRSAGVIVNRTTALMEDSNGKGRNTDEHLPQKSATTGRLKEDIRADTMLLIGRKPRYKQRKGKGRRWKRKDRGA